MNTRPGRLSGCQRPGGPWASWPLPGVALNHVPHSSSQPCPLSPWLASCPCAGHLVSRSSQGRRLLGRGCPVGLGLLCPSAALSARLPVPLPKLLALLCSPRNLRGSLCVPVAPSLAWCLPCASGSWLGSLHLQAEAPSLVLTLLLILQVFLPDARVTILVFQNFRAVIHCLPPEPVSGEGRALLLFLPPVRGVLFFFGCF